MSLSLELPLCMLHQITVVFFCICLLSPDRGGGPGGIGLAVALGKFNDPKNPVLVDLYESQPEIATVGAGITIWPRTRALLHELGIMQHFQGELNAHVQAGQGGKGMWPSDIARTR